MRRLGLRWLLVLVPLLVAPIWALQTVAKGSVLVDGLLALSALPAAYLIGRFGWLTPGRIGVLAALAAGAGALSALTGMFNGLTDEPYTTGLYNGLFPDLYGHPLPALTYVQFGRTVSLGPTYDVYLPLLGLFTVPGLGYRWVSLSAWLAMVLMLRRRPFAMAALATPYVAVIAASGFNDFVPLALLTAGFAVEGGAASKVAQVLALGTKQFCLGFALVYYALRKQWSWVVASAGITTAFLLPFFLISPEGTVCHALESNPGPCGQTSALLQSRFILPHLNYWLYPLWALAIFGPPTVAWLRSPALAPSRERAARWVGTGREWPVLAMALALTIRDRLRRSTPSLSPGTTG